MLDLLLSGDELPDLAPQDDEADPGDVGGHEPAADETPTVADTVEFEVSGGADVNPVAGQASTVASAGNVMAGQVVPVGRHSGTEVVLASSAAASTASGADAPAELDWLASASAGLVDWARGRRLGLASACGISLALAIISAAWFSAGTRTDVARGVAALWTGYLVLSVGYRLDLMAAAEGMRLRRAAVPARWLAVLTGTLVECLAYAGLAVGAAAGHWRGVWPLAVAVLGLTGVRSLMTACSIPPGFGDRPAGLLSRISAAALTMPAGGRVLLAGLVTPIWGARTALFTLADWSVVALILGLAGRARRPGATGMSDLVRLRDDGALARSAGRLVRGTLVPLPPAALGLLAVAALGVLGLRGLPAVLLIAPALILLLLAAPGSSHPHSGRFDWLVPALLLGAQICYLAAVGRSAHVPAPVTFALVAALLLHYANLCCPGRPVLVASSRGTDRPGSERGSGLGWEGRMLVAGIAAATGIATAAYVVLAAYLVALIVLAVVTRSVARPPAPARSAASPSNVR